MNKNIVRGLVDDVVAQVLDNMGFRVLAVLFLIPVLVTFVVGFREEDILILFHWHLPYETLLSGFGNVQVPQGELRAGLLQSAEVLFLDYVADKFGVLFGVASVAFFVPRIMEKGAADTVFSKPVSRAALLMSRYVAGLVFVGLLATLLVGGMYLGFRFVSDYDNPGILWGIATLTYGFAVFHAISVVVGVFTRNTIAAILLTFVFMPINCTVHSVWQIKDFTIESQKASVSTDKGAKDASATAPEPDAKPVESDKDDEKSDDGEDRDALWVLKETFFAAVDTLHYVLPKTGDTTLIAKNLRKHIEDADKELVDDESQLSLAEAPRGFTRELRSSLNRDEGLLWIAKHPSGGGEAHWTLARAKFDAGASRSTQVKALKKRIESDPNASELESARGDVAGRVAERVQWHEKRGQESRLRRQWIFQGGDYMFTLDYDAELDWALDEERELSARAFLAGFAFADDDAFSRSPMNVAYESRFGWSAPLKYNAWFSIASTLAFVVLLLTIGWWRLSRVDF